jgi:hypothetical protein
MEHCCNASIQQLPIQQPRGASRRERQPGSKRSFLQKRTKKPLSFRGLPSTQATRQEGKSFCFFFQKEVLP